LAAEIAARVTRQAFPAFVEEHVFRPLGMRATSLGLGGRAISQTMQSQVDEVNDYDWNSPYWRNLASPWGGAHAPARDVAEFLRYFAKPDNRVLKPETAAAMISDQTKGLQQRYGWGWRLQQGKFANGCSTRTYGHSGSTGTLSWLDPAKDLTLVLLTTKPAVHSNGSVIQPVSDLVASAAA
jgi:CubicO group peptidase (beta-lactamase class C family)